MEIGESRWVSVQKRTVDSEVRRLGLNPVLAKIGAQSHEPGVIEGMKATLERRPVVMALIGEPGLAIVRRRMEELGYESFRILRQRLERPPWPQGPETMVLFATPEQVRNVPMIAGAIRSPGRSRR